MSEVGEPGVVVVVAAADLLVLGEEHGFGDPLVGVGVVVFVDPVDGVGEGLAGGVDGDVLGEDVAGEELVVGGGVDVCGPGVLR